MAWDIIIRDLPTRLVRTADVPKDFMAAPIGDRDYILAKIREVVPNLEIISDQVFVLKCKEFYIVGWLFRVPNSPSDLDSILLEVKTGGKCVSVIADILEKTNLRAVDTLSESGIFDRVESAVAYSNYKKYVGINLQSKQKE